MVKTKTNKQRSSPGPSTRPKQNASPRGGASSGVVRKDAPAVVPGTSSSGHDFPVRATTKFLKRTSEFASGDEIILWISEFCQREDRPNYGVANETAIRIWERAVYHGPVFASRLISFVVGGNNSKATTQTQLADLLDAIEAPDLKTVAILRPGLSSKYFERAVYDFLSASTALKHVSLSWHCCFQAGFSEYLESNAASRLMSLSLQTNADIKHRVLYALVEGHGFPYLRKLSLQNIQGLTAQRLLSALETRYVRGQQRRLAVEVTCKVPDDIVKRARALGITFTQIGPDDLLVKGV
ncbi:hypothetical protein BD626DRAFT_493402 [Schizophyllum amplum]|uniref:Uncharacterized protein n=1 Tax=Schizophyllum amplum TaxID=97359 RepID=A0A550CGS0_9AGAR|nr:hypothetical protein BD626DRAFT_493402 [Auriculariopsis ampla]